MRGSPVLTRPYLEIFGVYRGSISRIEGKSRTVTDIELHGLSKILGVSVLQLLHNDNK